MSPTPVRIAHSARALAALLVLARAVRSHVEHRILLNGHRTVVFR